MSDLYTEYYTHKSADRVNFWISICILVLQVAVIAFLGIYVARFLRYDFQTLIDLLSSMRIPFILMAALSFFYILDGLSTILSSKSTGLNLFAAITEGAFLVASVRPLMRLAVPIFGDPEAFIGLYGENWIFPAVALSLGLLVLTVVVNLIDIIFMAIDRKKHRVLEEEVDASF